MRLRLLVPLAALCALVVTAPAYATPRLTKAQTKEISALVDRFVKDVVLRRNLPDGWRIAGPEMRGGTTEKAWNAGRNVPVQQFDARGRSWAHAWSATYEAPNEFGLDVNLQTGPRANTTFYDMEMDIVRVHGRWVVDSFYAKAVIRLGKGHRGSCATTKCAITGLNDFKAGGPGNPTAPQRLGNSWLWLAVGGIAGVPLTALLVYILYGRRQSRRAWQAYVNNANRAS